MFYSGIFNITVTPTTPAGPPGIDAVVVGAGTAAGVVVVAVVVLVCFLVIFCDCNLKVSGIRCFIREPRQDLETGAGPSQPNETYEMKQPEIHMSPKKYFHARDTPTLCRQIARPNGSRNNSLDPLEPIYNVSMISAVSGESALTDDGSLSNPPSPTVSDIHNESPYNR